MDYGLFCFPYGLRSFPDLPVFGKDYLRIKVQWHPSHHFGTLVYASDVTSFAVECVSADGMTVWLADFFAEELEFLG